MRCRDSFALPPSMRSKLADSGCSASGPIVCRFLGTHNSFAEQFPRPPPEAGRTTDDHDGGIGGVFFRVLIFVIGLHRNPPEEPRRRLFKIVQDKMSATMILTRDPIPWQQKTASSPQFCLGAENI